METQPAALTRRLNIGGSLNLIKMRDDYVVLVFCKF